MKSATHTLTSRTTFALGKRNEAFSKTQFKNSYYFDPFVYESTWTHRSDLYYIMKYNAHSIIAEIINVAKSDTEKLMS